MEENLLFELIKFIENGIEYDIDETEKLLKEDRLFEELKEKNKCAKTVINSSNDIIEKIKANYSNYKNENGEKYPQFTNGLSLICCIIIEQI